MKRITTVIFILLLSSTRVYAGSGGGAVFDFLKIDTNARPAALGGTFVAVADDVNAIGYNPAGLGDVEKDQATFMYNQWFQGVRQEYIGFVHKKGFGASINYLNYGDIQRTTINNPRGIGLDKFSNYDFSLSAGYGKRVLDRLLLGMSLKYITETIDKYSAWSLAMDGGVLYRIPAINLDIGLALQNIGTTVKFRTTAEDLPLNLKLGLCYRFLNKKGLVALDFNKQIDGIYSFNFGAEYSLVNFLILRAGFNGRNQVDSGLVGGLGINYSDFVLDYAISPYGDLGLTHRISISRKFGKRKEEKKEKLTKEPGELGEIIKTAEEAKKAMEELMTAPGIMVKREEVLISTMTEADQEKEISEEKIIVTATEEAIHFAFDSAEIKPEDYPVLDKIANLIKGNPDYRIEIEGYTDNIGEEEINERISEARAESAKRYFIEKANLPQEIFTTRGFGETKPIASNETMEGRAKNRRVEVILKK